MELNSFVSDFYSLLNKYLSKEQSDRYFGAMSQTFYFDDSLNISRVELIASIFGEKISSESIRLLTDTLFTFTSNEISEDKFIEFVLDFSKLVLEHGEINLTFELANNVLALSNSKIEYTQNKAIALLLIAEYYMKQASWKEAVNSIKQAIGIFENLNNKDGLAKCEFLMGSMYVEKGDLKAGKIRLENCLNYIDKEKDILLLAMIEVHFGIIAYIESNLSLATDYYEKALSKFEALGDKRRKAEVLQNIGMIYRQQGEYKMALAIYDECMTIAKTFGFKPILNLCLLNQAEIYLIENKIEDSFKVAKQSMNLSYLLNDRLSIADIHKIFGRIAKIKENYLAAENYFLTSLRLNNDLNQELNAAETNYELGLLYKNLGEKTRAFNHLLNAYKYYNKNNSKVISTEIESHLSLLAN